MTTEIAKLKEQNEQLKRQVEEIQKQLKKPTEK
jgi:cell division septum initiation protein DivIVA